MVRLYFDLFGETKAITIAMIVLLAVFVVILISLIGFRHFDERHIDKMANKRNTIRIFVLDVKNDCVSYFNPGNLKYRKNTSLTNFYSQYSSDSRLKLINWINALVSGNKNAKMHMEIPIYIKKFKKELGSMLQVEKVDTKKQIIYLESHIIDSTSKKRQKRKNSPFVSKEEFIASFHGKKARGISLCINFFNKNSKVNELEHLFYLEVKNILSKIADDNIVMLAFDYSKFLITNYEITDTIETNEFIELIRNKINSYLSIESLTDEIDFSIGCTDNNYFYHDIKSLIKSITTLSENAKDNGEAISFFDQNTKKLGNDSVLRTEVENIIHQEKLVYKYQLLFDFSKSKAFGYTAIFECKDSVFKSLNDLKNFAVRTDDDKKLFNAISKNSISNFVEEKYLVNLKLMFEINVNEISYINTSLVHLKDVGDANLIVLFSDNEISSLADDAESLENISDQIRTIKSHGFEVGLKIDDRILNLTPSFYSLFDYFVLSVRDFVGNNIVENIPVFKGLIEQLLKYKKTIVAVNIDSWDIVELVYKFGINILCGDGIVHANENILPLDRKVLARIKKLVA